MLFKWSEKQQWLTSRKSRWSQNGEEVDDPHPIEPNLPIINCRFNGFMVAYFGKKEHVWQKKHVWPTDIVSVCIGFVLVLAD